MLQSLKTFLSRFIAPLYFTTRWNVGVVACTTLFVLRFFLQWIGIIPYAALLLLVSLFFIDFILLFLQKQGLVAERLHVDRLSNGDDNEISIRIINRYDFSVNLEVIDEIPVQFQRRDILFKLMLSKSGTKLIHYHLRPVKRGEYEFGSINLYAATLLGLIRRRYTYHQKAMVPVYPSYLQMRRYQLIAISNRLTEAGIKKVRRIGHSMEFEQVKEYVQGDDYRTLNWKATARKGQLMVNNYTEEKSQQVYCIIDKSRVMKMPFEGMSLLDYAINASLVLSNVALLKQDKAGLVTFSEKMGAFITAGNRPLQMQTILEVLYRQKTRYLESDYEQLYTTLRRKVSQRSLLVLFTNFESVTSMRRQLPYLRKIATHHLLVVVFFENTELKIVTTSTAKTVEEVYTKTVAEKFVSEKRLIAKELQQYGISSILTSPADLTVNTINKYIALKARQAI